MFGFIHIPKVGLKQPRIFRVYILKYYRKLFIYTLLFKTLGLVRFKKKKVCSAHQGCICLIKNTVVILLNIITILINWFDVNMFKSVMYSNLQCHMILQKSLYYEDLMLKNISDYCYQC